MSIEILSSKISFKSPVVGQPTYANENCYNGRRVMALVDGEERLYRIKKDELAFDVDEDDIIKTIEQIEQKKAE